MAEERKEKAERPAITKKKAQVEEFKKDFSASQNIVIIDLRNLPDRLLQNVRKKLREKGTRVVVAKSAVMTRALEGAKKPKELIELFENPAAVVITKTTPYELNQFFKQNNMDVAAKPGQIAPQDIIVPAGETDLAPGPALSELKAAGLNAQIRGPKISIVKDSTVVKAGDEITLEKAKALQTLGFKPFKVKVNILLAYDGEYIYAPELLDISAESLAPEFVESLTNAFNLSVNADVPTEQNITLLLTQAFTQGTNVGVNGIVYSPQSIEQLLAQSIRSGLALSGLKPAEPESAKLEEPAPAAGEPKPKEKAGEPKAEEKAEEKPKEEPKEEPKAKEKAKEKPKAEEKPKEPKDKAKAEEKPKEVEKPKEESKPEEKPKPSDASAEEKPKAKEKPKEPKKEEPKPKEKPKEEKPKEKKAKEPKPEKPKEKPKAKEKPKEKPKAEEKEPKEKSKGKKEE